MKDTYGGTRLTGLCKELIGLPSYSGQEKQVAEHIAGFMKEAGFDQVHVDAYGSVIGGIIGKRPGKVILMDGHIDTVPVSNRSEWNHDPFSGEETDGRIYGRGTSDMKGAVSAMLCAAADVASIRDRDFSGKVYFSGTVHEECFEGIAARAVSRAIHPDCVIIGEASDLNLMIGQRGRAELTVETKGVSCHSANAEKGVNAVYQMCKAIEAIRKIKMRESRWLGKAAIELTDIASRPYPGASVVPSQCIATFDRRLLINETQEEIVSEIRSALDELKKNDETFSYNADISEGSQKCWTGIEISERRFFPAWLMDQEHELVKAAEDGLRGCGLPSKLSCYQFCTNGSHFAGEAGIPTIGFGPSSEKLAHIANEYIEVGQLTGAYRGYKGILSALIKQSVE